jgi:pSer/pThr/pTyr-binding forkhead associated (FHA) protein
MRLILASGQSVELVKSVYTVGRAPNNDIVLADASVSRAHYRLQRTQSGYIVRDLGSQNGTFVNGKRIQTETSLREGDALRVGSVTVQAARSTTHATSTVARKTHAQTPPQKTVVPTKPRARQNWMLLVFIVFLAFFFFGVIFVVMTNARPNTNPGATAVAAAQQNNSNATTVSASLASANTTAPTRAPSSTLPNTLPINAPPTETEPPPPTAYTYNPPRLLEPADGSLVSGQTILRWTSDQSLRSNDIYQVTMWRKEDVQERVVGETRVQEYLLDSDTIKQNAFLGDFVWAVQIASSDGTRLSRPSQPFTFRAVPPSATPTVEPTAREKPDHPTKMPTDVPPPPTETAPPPPTDVPVPTDTPPSL